MQVEQALAACEAAVREHDPDRFLSALFAPADKRPLLFTLYAFNHEIARIGESVREPMMGEIRLQWWREAVESARAGRPRDHEVVLALAHLFEKADVPGDLFEALIDARACDLPDEEFADIAALETYADATSGAVMRIAAQVLGSGEQHDSLTRAAGTAYGLTGLLRSLPFHAMRRKLYLPLDIVAREGLSSEFLFAGREREKVKAVMAAVAERARHHFDAARAFAKPGGAFASVLPAATVPAYLKQMAGPGFDPFVTRAELPLYRRQLSMLRANLRGHI
jgi:phytoene synthase